MKKILFTVLASILGFLNVYAQVHSSFHLQSRIGIQTDLPNGASLLGGGLGMMINLISDENPWQAGLHFDKYSNKDFSELNYHGYKRWSAAISMGKMWTTDLNIAEKPLKIGGGALLISTLHLREAPGGNKTVATPSMGLYMRLEYPLFVLTGKQVSLVTDSSLFGDGYMRNILGISFPLAEMKP